MKTVICCGAKNANYFSMLRDVGTATFLRTSRTRWNFHLLIYLPADFLMGQVCSREQSYLKGAADANLVIFVAQLFVGLVEESDDTANAAGILRR